MANTTGLKFGGRKVGTPNRKTGELVQKLDEHGFDAVDYILEKLPQVPVEQQLKVAVELLAYIFPKRKALEVSHAGQHERDLELMERMEEAKKRAGLAVNNSYCPEDYEGTEDCMLL